MTYATSNGALDTAQPLFVELLLGWVAVQLKPLD
jgi:hypothetical protein